MHLTSDYIHPYKDAGGRPSHCRVRIYLPDDPGDALVVICSELPNNPGGSITNSADMIAAGVIRAHELPTPLVWIEHWPEESADEQETFELVVFSSYHVVERAPYLGETRAWIGDATWKPLDRATVEVLVGGKVQDERCGWLARVSFRRNPLPQARQKEMCFSKDHPHDLTQLFIELSRAALMWTLHERSVDKRQTPDPGEE